MQVIETAREMREFRRAISDRVVMVATLGGMHEGHKAHLVKARDVADVTIGSLFLNPTQFSAAEDLAKYPVDREADLALFENHGAAAVFAPSVEEMYPPGDSFRVDPGKIATVLEGAYRPGHFVSVATVVAKLFSIIRPDVATFGEKDAQQLRIIEKMSRELMFGVEIVRIPTVREPDGLAMSTRNRYLNEEQRRVAPALYRSLCSGRDLWNRGERDADPIRSHVKRILESEELLQPEYVSLAHPESLEEFSGNVGSDALLSLAVRLGPARLIDNVLLD